MAYPDHPQALGDHLKRKRLLAGLLQRQAAEAIGVSHATLLHWENGRAGPSVGSYPAIIRFLGYVPFPEPQTLAERLLRFRRTRGWSIAQTARFIGVDEGAWGRWEQGTLPSCPTHVVAIATLLASPNGDQQGS